MRSQIATKKPEHYTYAIAQNFSSVFMEKELHNKSGAVISKY